jgi:hypothetical protein
MCYETWISVQADLDRFLALVRRELGAEESRVLEPDEAPTDEASTLYGRLADGRAVAARFSEPPVDRDAKQRRLDMLASTFDTLVEDVAHARKSRPPLARSLHDELGTLCVRAVALNAVVIDAHSPVVWAAAHPEGVVAQPPLASSPRVAESPANEDGGGEPRMATLSRRALHEVRGLPDLATLRKGKHVRYVERSGDAPRVVHSFAGIYLLVVVFDGPFDELRAERAILEALPRVERLVLALPPLDPSPSTGAGVIALRRPRRR